MLDCRIHRHIYAGCLCPRHRSVSCTSKLGSVPFLRWESWIHWLHNTVVMICTFLVQHLLQGRIYMFKQGILSPPETILHPSCPSHVLHWWLPMLQSPTSTIPVPPSGPFDVSANGSIRFDLRFVPIDGPFKPARVRVQRERFVEARGRSH